MKNISEALVDPSILIPKTQLYPKFWDPKVRKLNSQYLQRLKEIAKAFVSTFDFQIKIKDIIFTGSLANYNWNQYSDVDLHIVVDFADIPDEYLEAFKDYFDAKKENWNNKHNIMIGGHEVELYIQDVEEPHHSSGVYSIMNDRWLTEPRHFEQDLDYEKIVDRTEQYADEIARAQEFYAAGDLNRALNYIDRLRAKLKKYRQAGLKSEGEYSTENLVFKSLRNGGYLEQLAVLKRQISDKKLSLDESLIAEKLDRCARIAKRKYKVWPSAYASGAAVKCRQGKIWKGVKEETEIEEDLNEIELDENDLEEILDEKADFSKEKDQGLHGWFARQGGEGKSKGWVDCNTCRKDAETGKKTCKSCGRGEGEKRTKYPACRPTPSQCTRSGMKRKKSSKQVSWKSKED